MDGESAVEAAVELADVLAELQAVHADMSALASHGDMMIIAACLLLLVGVVIGAVAAACVGRWTR